MTQYLDATDGFISSQERIRLVRLCATITGSSEAAEDLAQETLLEAWRHLEGLRDPDKRTQWLSGIARNVCLRWNRRLVRDLSHQVPLETANGQDGAVSEETFADTFDLEIELERKELIELLDRAMSALPLDTRTALVQHYVEELPLAEIAGELGLNASAVAMRLQRGRLVLRRELSTRMPDEIASYGYDVSRSSEWETTRLWCELCGHHRLLGKIQPDQGSIELRCPACCRDSGAVYNQSHHPGILRGTISYKRALSQLRDWARSYYLAGTKLGSAPCLRCGKMLPVQRCQPGETPGWRVGGDSRWLCGSEQRHGIAFICPTCNSSCICLSDGLVQWTPEARQFLREHPRIRTLPEREVVRDGKLALVTRLESVTSSLHLDIVTALDTYETLHISRG